MTHSDTRLASPAAPRLCTTGLCLLLSEGLWLPRSEAEWGEAGPGLHLPVQPAGYGQPLLTCRERPSALSRRGSPSAQRPLKSVLEGLMGRGCPPTSCKGRSALRLQLPAQTRAPGTSRVLSTAEPAGIFRKDFAEIRRKAEKATEAQNRRAPGARSRSLLSQASVPACWVPSWWPGGLSLALMWAPPACPHEGQGPAPSTG